MLLNKSKYQRIILIIIASVMIASSVNIIFEPVGMVTGGLSGLGIVIKHVTKGGIPVWATNMLFNIPLFLCSLKIKGKKFLYNTIFAAMIFNISLFIIPSYNVGYEDLLLAAIFGGVLSGAGMGIILSVNTCTGGSDLLGILIHSKLDYYSVAQILMVVDSIIIIIGAFTFGVNKAFYAIIAVFIMSKTTDMIIEGGKFAKMVFIISKNDKAISNEIITTLNRGVTGIKITGMYSNDNKNMLMCVISKKELTKLASIIYKFSDKNFIIICDVREVRGEGFIEYDSKS